MTTQTTQPKGPPTILISFRFLFGFYTALYFWFSSRFIDGLSNIPSVTVTGSLCSLDKLDKSH